jgi:hypothetical protein
MTAASAKPGPDVPKTAPSLPASDGFVRPDFSPGVNFSNLTALDERDELVPFGVRQPDGVGILPDCYRVVGDHNFGALHAERAQAKFFSVPPDGHFRLVEPPCGIGRTPPDAA